MVQLLALVLSDPPLASDGGLEHGAKSFGLFQTAQLPQVLLTYTKRPSPVDPSASSALSPASPRRRCAHLDLGRPDRTDQPTSPPTNTCMVPSRSTTELYGPNQRTLGGDSAIGSCGTLAVACVIAPSNHAAASEIPNFRDQRRPPPTTRTLIVFRPRPRNPGA
jgi:hypothetical protein